MLTNKTPLKYPGGKTRAKKYILPYFPRTNEIVSPFCGSCGIELDLAAKGIRVHAYDMYEDLINFWNLIKHNPERLYNTILKHHPIDKGKFFKCVNFYEYETDNYEKVAQFYIVNKCSYGSFTFAKSPFFSKGVSLKQIENIKTFYNPNITFKCLDFETSLSKHEDKFAYLDPPYITSQFYYGKNGHLHKNFDHERLAKVLKARKTPWVLSYNNCDKVKELYQGYRFEYPIWLQSINHKEVGFASSNEILIINE